MLNLFTCITPCSFAADGELVTLDKEQFLESFTRALFDESPHGKKIKICIGKYGQAVKNIKAFETHKSMFNIYTKVYRWFSMYDKMTEIMNNHFQ